MYEHHSTPVLTRTQFALRLTRHALLAFALVAFSLILGMAGYTYFEHLAWRDAFLNSAMLLGGMGPVDAPRTDGGKIFAGLYALYAGLVFIASAGVIFAPVVHRVLHKLHQAEARDAAAQGKHAR
ncbi:MAG TPA: hypothetical protein VNT02_11880 [Burkholderiales bacterium]|nr:hypothetical protein [Burkholderiales bacterium]